MSRTLALITAGVVSNVVVGELADFPGAIDITELNPRPGPGWTYVDGEFTPPAENAPPPPATSPRMTHLYFLSRFTPAERLAVREATQADPVLDDAMFLFNAARDIDVTLPMTQQLVGYMAQQGLIAPGRVPELLAEAPLGENGVLP
ncbi:MAG: hypothetical protein KatS3mg127_1256 [Silanimonas sp.]|nr:MAG: hypothetical protein KatS3mg127_1256 [Silanimonas sp.]